MKILGWWATPPMREPIVGHLQGGVRTTSEGNPPLVPGAALLFGTPEALSVGRGCDPRIDHYLVDGVSSLSNDDLQVQVGHAWNHKRLGSSAIRVDRVATGARTPTGREVAVVSDSVNLSHIASAVKCLQGDAINQYGATVGEEDCAVK